MLYVLVGALYVLGAVYVRCGVGADFGWVVVLGAGFGAGWGAGAGSGVGPVSVGEGTVVSWSAP